MGTPKLNPPSQAHSPGYIQLRHVSSHSCISGKKKSFSIRNIVSASSSSSKQSKSSRNRSRYRKPHHLRTHGFQNFSEQRNHPPGGFQPKVEPLMGVRLPHNVLSASIPAKKIPFIIQAHSDGNIASRTVLVNPSFGS